MGGLPVRRRWTIWLVLLLWVLTQAAWTGVQPPLTRPNPHRPEQTSGTTFRSVRSGPWSDPRTWGFPDAPQPGVTVPDEESHVIIGRDTRVWVDRPRVRVARLSVNTGGVLSSSTGMPLRVDASGDILNQGSIVSRAWGDIVLTSEDGRVVNEGLILAGEGRYPFAQGGSIHLRARHAVENWGHVQSRGPDSWIALEAPQGTIRNRGEVRGGPRSTLLLAGLTVDTAGGNVLTGSAGTVFLRGERAILAGGRGTRVAGKAIYAYVHTGLLDLPDQETMGWLARGGDIGLLGGPEARLNVTGNRARFAPFHSEGGKHHVGFNENHRNVDPGLSLDALFNGPVDIQPGREVGLVWALPRRLPPAYPGRTLQWTWDVVNVGFAPATIRPTFEEERGWTLSWTPQELPDLAPGERGTITLTLQVPTQSPPGAGDTVVLRLRGDGLLEEPALSYALRVVPRPAYFPWVGHRATADDAPRAARHTAAPTVFLTWPGAEDNRGPRGSTLLLLYPLDGMENILGGDVAYWDGLRWVPIASAGDMTPGTTDGVWVAEWDASTIPLNAVYLRGRLWDDEGNVGEVVRSTFLHHPPVAQATATFLEDGRVQLDAGLSVDLDGDIAEYTWDLGDGNTATGKVVTHTFSLGEFTVRLRVRDEEGQEDEATYRLDTRVRTWAEASQCGCRSLRLVEKGTPVLPLPWEDAAHQQLGPDIGSVGEGMILRLNWELEATLTEGSNPRACRVMQLARGTWRWKEGTSERVETFTWNGQSFPVEENALGLVGYTRPGPLSRWSGDRIRWALGGGWGWRPLEQGIPHARITEGGWTWDGVYQAHVAGPEGTCLCTWNVHVHVTPDGTPTIQVNKMCGE